MSAAVSDGSNRASLGVVLLGHPSDLAGRAAALESAGIDSLWTGEYFRSAIARAAVMASATSRVTVGTHVLQAFARSPLTAALAAQDLQELSGGRFVLGLGSQVATANQRWHGVATPRPVTELREYVGAVRTLMSAPHDERVVVRGPRWDLDVPAFRPARSAPPPAIHVGGAGPGSVRLAAAVADGMHGHLFWTMEHVREHVRPILDDGPGPWMPLAVPRLVAPLDVTGSLVDASRQLAHYATTPSYQRLLSDAGVGVDRSALLDALRRQDEPGLVEQAAPLVDRFCIRDATRLAGTLTCAAEAGVDAVLLVVPSLPDAGSPVDDYEDALLTLVADLRAGDHASQQPTRSEP